MRVKGSSTLSPGSSTKTPLGLNTLLSIVSHSALFHSLHRICFFPTSRSRRARLWFAAVILSSLPGRISQSWSYPSCRDADREPSLLVSAEPSSAVPVCVFREALPIFHTNGPRRRLAINIFFLDSSHRLSLCCHSIVLDSTLTIFISIGESSRPILRLFFEIILVKQDILSMLHSFATHL